MFRDKPLWVDLGDGSIIDALIITAIGVLIEPEEWDDGKDKRAWNAGFRTVISYPGGAIVSRRPTEEVSAEVMELTK